MNIGLMGLVCSLIILNMFDFLITWFGVKKGLAKEINPIMNLIMRMGYKQSFFFKMIMTMVFGLYCIVNNNQVALLIANGIFLGVCIWNTFLMRRRLRNLGKTT